MKNSNYLSFTFSRCLFTAFLLSLIGLAAAATGGKPSAIKQDAPEGPHVIVRMASYNVLFGNWGTPKRIGEMFKSYNLDLICFSEVPGGDWTRLVGQELDMQYFYVGKISSANHKDKYKSILSRTPLYNLHEIEINAMGWAPASMVGGETEIQGIKFLIYSLHIPARPNSTDSVQGSAAEFIAKKVIPEIHNERYVLMGDFNNHVGDAPLNLLEHAGLRNTWVDLDIDFQKESTHQHIETGTESGLIDHIYYNTSAAVEVLDGGIIYDAKNPPGEEKSMPSYHAEWLKYGKPLSDHRPIWVAIQW